MFSISPTHTDHLSSNLAKFLAHGLCHFTSPSHPQAITSLSNQPGFSRLSNKEDENEHSIELQLPFISKIFNNIKIIPILIGEISNYKLFSKSIGSLFENDKTLFVISSDFCHWGKRFRYTYLPENLNNCVCKCEPVYDKVKFPINSKIETLDRMGN